VKKTGKDENRKKENMKEENNRNKKF